MLLAFGYEIMYLNPDAEVGGGTYPLITLRAHYELSERKRREKGFRGLKGDVGCRAQLQAAQADRTGSYRLDGEDGKEVKGGMEDGDGWMDG